MQQETTCDCEKEACKTEEVKEAGKDEKAADKEVNKDAKADDKETKKCLKSLKNGINQVLIRQMLY